MSRFRSVLVGLCVVLLGGSFWVLIAPSLPETDPVAPTPAAASPVKPIPLEKALPVIAATLKERAGVAVTQGTAAFQDLENGWPKMPKNADIERFLAKHGVSAKHLVVAFNLRGDPKWLEKALELYPDSPMVLMTALSQHEAWKDPRAAGWLEAYKRVESKSPLPWLYAAQGELNTGHLAQAMDELRLAMDRPGLYTYLNERADTAALIFEMMGRPKSEAELLGLVTLPTPWLQTALSISKQLEKAKKTEGAEVSFVQESTALQYSLAKMFQSPEASRVMIGQLVGVALEKLAMDALPPEEQTRRTAAMEALRDEIKLHAGALEQMLQTSNSGLYSGYVKRVRLEGDIAASRWLRAQQKAAGAVGQPGAN